MNYFAFLLTISDLVEEQREEHFGQEMCRIVTYDHNEYRQDMAKLLVQVLEETEGSSLRSFDQPQDLPASNPDAPGYKIIWNPPFTGRTWPSCWCRSWRRPRGPPSGPSINPRTYLPPTLTHPGTRSSETPLLQAGHGQAAGAGPGGDRGVLPQVLRSTPGPTCLQPWRTRVQDHLKPPFYRQDMTKLLVQVLEETEGSSLRSFDQPQDLPASNPDTPGYKTIWNPPFTCRTWPSC